MAGKVHAGLWGTDVSVAGELSGDPDKWVGGDWGVFDRADEVDHDRVLIRAVPSRPAKCCRIVLRLPYSSFALRGVLKPPDTHEWRRGLHSSTASRRSESLAVFYLFHEQPDVCLDFLRNSLCWLRMASLTGDPGASYTRSTLLYGPTCGGFLCDAYSFFC